MKSRLLFSKILGTFGLLLPILVLLTLRILVPWEGWLQPALAWLGKAGWWGMVLAVLLYVPLGVFMVPASTLTILVGVAHGFWSGLACVTLGANLAAWAAFGLARIFSVGAKTEHSQSRRLLSRINARAAHHGFWVVTLARLSVFVPYGPLNYLLGFSRIRFTDYALGTFLGMLPGSALYLWAGTFLAADPATGTLAGNILAVVGLLALALLLALVGRVASQSINESDRPKTGPAKLDECLPPGPDQAGSGAASNSAITTS